MSDNEKAGVGCIVTAICIPLSVLANGYALSVLWAWFMVPLFHLPPVGIAGCGGISLLVHMLTDHDTPVDKDREWWLTPVLLCVKPLAVLFFGDVYRMFM